MAFIVVCFPTIEEKISTFWFIAWHGTSLVGGFVVGGHCLYAWKFTIILAMYAHKSSFIDFFLIFFREKIKIIISLFHFERLWKNEGYLEMKINFIRLYM